MPKDKVIELVDLHCGSRNALIDVDNTLNVLRKLRATVEVMREYRFYLEVKYKIKKL